MAEQTPDALVCLNPECDNVRPCAEHPSAFDIPGYAEMFRGVADRIRASEAAAPPVPEPVTPPDLDQGDWQWMVDRLLADTLSGRRYWMERVSPMTWPQIESAIRADERARAEALLRDDVLAIEARAEAAEERVRALEGMLLSGTSVFDGGEMRSLTWQEATERARAEVSTLSAYHSILSDLSRCEHGRHLGDVCSECGGPSVGNTILPPGMVIGHDIGGRPITVPAKAQFASAADWRPAEQRASEGQE